MADIIDNEYDGHIRSISVSILGGRVNFIVDTEFRMILESNPRFIHEYARELLVYLGENYSGGVHYPWLFFDDNIYYIVDDNHFEGIREATNREIDTHYPLRNEKWDDEEVCIMTPLWMIEAALNGELVLDCINP